MADQLLKDWSTVCASISAGRLLQAAVAAVGQQLMRTGSTLSTAARRLVSRFLAYCRVSLLVGPTSRRRAVLLLYLSHSLLAFHKHALLVLQLDASSKTNQREHGHCPICCNTALLACWSLAQATPASGETHVTAMPCCAVLCHAVQMACSP